MRPVMPKYMDWLRLVTLGTWESLFTDAESPALIDQFSKDIAQVLSCCVCAAQMTVGRADATRLFLDELVTCPECGNEQQFPLFWLMTAMDLGVGIKGRYSRAEEAPNDNRRGGEN
jgi:hypothetical protein